MDTTNASSAAARRIGAGRETPVPGDVIRGTYTGGPDVIGRVVEIGSSRRLGPWYRIQLDAPIIMYPSEPGLAQFACDTCFLYAHTDGVTLVQRLEPPLPLRKTAASSWVIDAFVLAAQTRAA